MKFSIVTPNYNYGRFLRKALESVFAQTEAEGAPDIEHIVIDGGSTDSSVQILNDWAAFAAAQSAAKAGRYSFSYVSEPDKGQTDAINKGLRRATGDIVAWLNADEWYLPGKLARVAEAFVRHPKVDFIYGEPLYVDGDGKPLRVKRDHPFSRFVLLYYGCYIASCCSFWKRHIQSEGGIFLVPSYKVTMDYEYYCHVCRAGYRFRFLPVTVAAFTWHEGNVSSQLANRCKVETLTVRRIYSPMFTTITDRDCWKYRIVWNLSKWTRRGLVVLRIVFWPLSK